MLMRSGLGHSPRITEDNHSCVLPWPVVRAGVRTEVWGGNKETHEGEEKMLIAAQNLQPEITTRNSPLWKSINYFYYFSPYIALHLTDWQLKELANSDHFTYLFLKSRGCLRFLNSKSKLSHT